MSLAVGDRLGPYEILAPIGAGGMGEVYRARDTKLRRDVAFKVLPEGVAHDADRLSRFEREARLLASLGHPHIASIFGIEESAGSYALVMELVEGPTLAERLQHGPLPIEEAIGVARQIAEAMEYAHDHNVIHRDLKPANIKITSEGSVKVLDFGLAKALTGDLVPASGSPMQSPTDSPTLSMRATQAGTILGTAAYMAPEQIKGKTVDRRADIWAFGVVLFEMLTGQALFQGDTVAEIMAAALKEEPKLDKLPAATPPAIRRLIERCLHKDPKLRLQSIGEARITLSDTRLEDERATPRATVADANSKGRFRMAPWAVAGVLFVALMALAFVHFRETSAVQPSLRFQILPPGATVPEYFTLLGDGRMLAFVASAGGPAQIWIHSMDALESRAIAGTDNASYPFWSPDGAYLGFFADGKLKKIAVAGGPPQTLCDATAGRGGTWNRNGVIVFSPGPSSPMFRVSAAGGNPVQVTKPLAGTATGDRFPSFLPDGEHFLYLAGSDKQGLTGLNIGSLDGAAPRRLLPDVTNAYFAPSSRGAGNGYLIFRREDTLMAQPFDPKSLKFAGDMFPLAEHVPISVNTGFGAYSVAANGTLVYRTGSEVVNRELAWLDRSGKRTGVVGKPGQKIQVSISPSEKTVAVTIGSSTRADIWLQDLQRDILTRFTFRLGAAFSPLWSPEGTNITYSLGGVTYGFDIIRKSVSGNGQEDLLVHAGLNATPDDWSPDGKWVVYQQSGQRTGLDLWLLPMDGEHKPVPYLETQFNEENGAFSPDGKWMAYDSDESGQPQVYVQAVPANGSKWQVSNAGGIQPIWRRDGKELFYVSVDDKLTAVPIQLGSTVALGTPQLLFDVGAFKQSSLQGISYAVSRDGQRFLISVPAGGPASAAVPSITVVTNWQSTLIK